MAVPVLRRTHESGLFERVPGFPQNGSALTDGVIYETKPFFLSTRTNGNHLRAAERSRQPRRRWVVGWDWLTVVRASESIANSTLPFERERLRGVDAQMVEGIEKINRNRRLQFPPERGSLLRLPGGEVLGLIGICGYCPGFSGSRRMLSIESNHLSCYR